MSEIEVIKRTVPVRIMSYPGEMKKLLARVAEVYRQPIMSVAGEVEREREIAQLYKRKREIETGESIFIR